MSQRNKTILKSFAKSTMLSALLILIFSGCMLWVDIPDGLLTLIAVLIIVFNCYLSAYISTQHDRNNGIVQGLKCGIINFIMILLVSLILGNFSFSNTFALKLILCIFSGAIGGIVGVNTKKTNIKM